jgi:hypothetical protein
VVSIDDSRFMAPPHASLIRARRDCPDSQRC